MIGKNGKNRLQENPKIIILFDSSCNFSYIEKIKQKNYKIITLDYKSHKLLNEKQIDHEISETYLTDKEIEELQKESFRFAKWFNNEIINESLQYENVNLGELFYVEFHYFLVPFLKKLHETIKIFNTYDKCKFVCSQILGQIIKELTSNVEIINSKYTEEKFLYDQIKFSFKLKNKSFSIGLPKKYYVGIKTFSEIFVNSFFGTKKTAKFEKNILTVEFDTKKYETFFSNIPKFPINLIFFGRRRPAIWDKKSFSIIKNSKCSVMTMSSLTDKDSKNSINEEILILKSKIKIFWGKEDFFKSYFSLDGFSFWNIIKPQFILLCEKRMIDAIHEISITKNLFKKIQLSSILIWSENGFNEQIVLKLAKKFNVKIFLLQHGLYYDTKDTFEFNNFAGIFPTYSDKILVWGEITQNHLIDSGFPKSQIEIIGSPAFDHLFNVNTKSTSIKNFILVATSSPTKNIVSDLTISTRENYIRFITNACNIAKKLDKNLVIKLHPFQDELEISDIVNKIYPSTLVIKNGSIVPLIKESDIVVVADYSTVILEAQILEKPVIAVSTKDYGFDNSSIFTSNSCIKVSLDDFEKMVLKITSDVEFEKQIIENGNDFVKKYLINPGNASENLLSFLCKS